MAWHGLAWGGRPCRLGGLCNVTLAPSLSLPSSPPLPSPLQLTAWLPGEAE